MGYSARRGFTNGKISGAARQAELQQKIAAMQEKMTAAQDAVEAQEFTASVGGGVVEAKVNGKKEVLSVTIKPEAVDPEDVEMLQDLVVSAVNEALRQANDAMDKSMEGVTGGSGSQRVRPVSRTCKAVQEYTVGSTGFRVFLYPKTGSHPRNRLAASAAGGASPVSPSWVFPHTPFLTGEAHLLFYRQSQSGAFAPLFLELEVQ